MDFSLFGLQWWLLIIKIRQVDSAVLQIQILMDFTLKNNSLYLNATSHSVNIHLAIKKARNGLFLIFLLLVKAFLGASRSRQL